MSLLLVLPLSCVFYTHHVWLSWLVHPPLRSARLAESSLQSAGGGVASGLELAHILAACGTTERHAREPITKSRATENYALSIKNNPAPSIAGFTVRAFECCFSPVYLQWA